MAVPLQPRGQTDTGWWTAGTVMLVITTVTIFANTAMMVALCRAKRAPSHYPLISLVSADLLVGITVLPIAAFREQFVFQLHRGICACWSVLDVLCCTASILSLCTLGWERWHGITTPLARARRARWARALAVLVWPVAILVALPAAFIPSPRHFHPEEMEKACTVNINTGYVFFSITFSFYLPTFGLMILYGFILKALSVPPPIRAHRGCIGTPHCQMMGSTQNTVNKDAIPNLAKTDNNHNLTVGLSPKARDLNLQATNIVCTEMAAAKSSAKYGVVQRQSRATRTIVTLMALFLICWTPYFIILPLDSIWDIVRDTTWQWCTWLGYVNSALNPFVYAAASPSVRRALRTNSSSRNREIPLTPRIQRA